MTTNTTNLALTLYGTTDSSALFFNYRNTINGEGTSSAFYKIDTFAGNVSGSLTSLQNRSQPIFVLANYVSPSYYEANSISYITSYLTNMQIDVQLDTENTGTVTLNINSLGTKTLQKIDPTSGSAVNMSAGDMKKGRDYLFRYTSGGYWVLTSSATADMISMSGSAGNYVTSSSGVLVNSGVPLISGVTSGSYNAVTVDQYGRVLSGSSINGGHIIQSSGSSLPNQSILNFISGSNVVLDIIDNISASSTDITVSSIDSGNSQQNQAINGSFTSFQRQVPATETTYADNKYCADGYITLSELGSIGVSRVAGDTDSRYAIQLKQLSATAQRMGLMQPIETSDTYPMREKDVVFSATVKFSTATDVMYAILDSGSAVSDDEVFDGDPVNDWTSAIYTNGNFFKSSGSVGIITTGSFSGSTSFEEHEITATIPATSRNLMFFMWTKGTVAQNVTMQITKWGIYAGTTAPTWQPPDIEAEIMRCKRYCHAVACYPSNTKIRVMGGLLNTTSSGAFIYALPVPMFLQPTMSYTDVSHFNVTDDVVVDVAVATLSISTTSSGYQYLRVIATVSGTPFTVGRTAALDINTASGRLIFEAKITR